MIAVAAMAPGDRARDARALLCMACGLLLAADAVVLMFLGVFNFGVTFPFAVGCALLALGWQWPAVQAWLDGGPARRAAWRWAWAGALVWLCSVALFWAVLARTEASVAATDPPAAILVLGSGSANGRPSPTLAARLDLALQQARRFPQAIVVVSGGVDFAGTRSEGEIMGGYLRAKGLAPQRIVQEEKSTSTEQNLLLSQPLLRRHGVSPRDAVLLVTSDFHTLRARWIAGRAGYAQVSLAGAPTPLYLRYNAWLREYFAVLSGFMLREFG